MAKKSKSNGLVAMEAPISMPRIHLSGKHGAKFAKHKVGSKVKMCVHCKKTGHNMYSTGKGSEHNVDFEIDEIEEMKGEGKDLD